MSFILPHFSKKFYFTKKYLPKSKILFSFFDITQFNLSMILKFRSAFPQNFFNKNELNLILSVSISECFIHNFIRGRKAF